MKAELYYTLSRKYSIAELRTFDNGAEKISINFYGLFLCGNSKEGVIILSIFSEVKEYLTARQAAEGYGLKVGKNGMACCPFHDDRHPSMKIDKNYHCFACGAGGDVVDYVSRLFGLSQYGAALKLAEDFRLPIETGRKGPMSVQERKDIRERKEKQERSIHIKMRFAGWCSKSIDTLKKCLAEIENAKSFLRNKAPEQIFTDDYTYLLQAEPIIHYWLDILCTGETAEKQELFIKNRKEVEEFAERVGNSRKRIMGKDRGNIGSRDEQRGRCAI